MKTLRKSLINIPGWRTSRKIAVFVSDDWGSVRTRSSASLARLRKLGVSVDDCHYMLFDHLETGDDLELLFELFDGFVDKNQRNPVLTANCLTSNPDFSEIKKSAFTTYHSESMLQTYLETKGCKSNLSIWEQAIRRGVCLPQSHGREHLNVARWMADLRNAERVARAAFEDGMFGVSAHTTVPPRLSYLAAFDSDEKGRVVNQNHIVSDALGRFRRIFGFASRSFIAPNYVWDATVERAAKDCGVDYIQSGTAQWLPSRHGGASKRRRRYQGQRNRIGQRYLVRNVHFEPSSDISKDWVGHTISEIELAFRFRKPAVISMHRVNFMGVLSSVNRDRGLLLLRELMSEMLKRWPDLEFLDAVELGDAMILGGGSR